MSDPYEDLRKQVEAEMNQPKAISSFLPMGYLQKGHPNPSKGKKRPPTERGELLKYFASKVGMPIGRMAFHVQHLQMKDLYFLKSDCDGAVARGVAFGAAFWSAIKAKKSTSNPQVIPKISTDEYGSVKP